MPSVLTHTLMQVDYPPEEYVRGTLKLRGGRNMPETTEYPDLQSKGASLLPELTWRLADIPSTRSSKVRLRLTVPLRMSIACTAGLKDSAKASRVMTKRLGIWTSFLHFTGMSAVHISRCRLR